ncbi:hypothetical protein FOZ60_001534 [Perkinsus olseni]|uniref:Uncharacterized protein n=1 Tax=Perkinsus olseni TaxID=32597 RepID=A0A7J6P0A7_PEROL|nr:hypothetical protein FOZ60_001534 [Perkinsus olseni]
MSSRRAARYAGDVDDWVEDCEKYGLDACIDQWVDETAQAACDYSYKHVNGSLVLDGDVLPMEYYESRIEPTKESLAKGGIRLTWLLNHLFANQEGTTKPVPVDCSEADKKCSNAWAS